MIKTNKNNGAKFRLLKIILIIIVGIVCFYQFKKLDLSNLNKVTLINSLPLFFAFLLVSINYWMEFLKWDLIIRATGHPTSVSVKIQSFFAGIITGMLTPNMQGNFIGRFYYFPRKVRLPITLLTLTSNLGQFCVTVVLGLFALFLLGDQETFFWIIPAMILILALLFYFCFERISFLSNQFKWYRHIGILLNANKRLRTQFLIYSLLRNSVFSIQFLLALHAFGAEIDWNTYWLIWELYLFTTLSPSLIFGKLFVRESIALWVFAPLAIPEWNIIAASFSVWVINLLLPTLSGLFICKKSAA